MRIDRLTMSTNRGAANITTHARNLTTTARRTDETRKTARQLKAERKAEQAAAIAEKTKREKGKKRREIEKRMEILKKELGDKAFEMLEHEMEGDWDEEVFDRAMDKVLEAGLDDVRVVVGEIALGRAKGNSADTSPRGLRDGQDEKPTWGDDIDTAYAEDDGDDNDGEDGGMDYADGEAEDYPETEQAYAPGGDNDEVEMEDEEPPLNMVSFAPSSRPTNHALTRGRVDRTPTLSRSTTPRPSGNNARKRRTRKRTRARPRSAPRTSNWKMKKV